MPKGFDKCVRDGGRIRTKKISNKKFMYICYKDGKSYPGYVKTKKGK